MPTQPRMPRSIIAAIAVFIAIVVTIASLPGSAGQPQSQVASVRQGTCQRLGGVVFELGQFPLSAATFGTPDAGAPVGLPSAIPVMTGEFEIDAAQNSLLQAPHALTLATTPDGPPLVCGDIGAVDTGEGMSFGVAEWNGSGYAGIAQLRSSAESTTSVTIMIAEGLAGTPVASPVAGASPVSSGDEEATEDVTVEMVDIDFNPNEFTIPAHTDVMVHLPNLGETVHNFHIDPLDVHSEDVDPGGETTVTINPEPGDYEYYCSIPGHREAGMVGTLHVE